VFSWSHLASVIVDAIVGAAVSNALHQLWLHREMLSGLLKRFALNRFLERKSLASREEPFENYIDELLQSPLLVLNWQKRCPTADAVFVTACSDVVLVQCKCNHS